MAKKKMVKLTEEQFYKAVSRMVLEYIGDNGMLGKQYLDDIEDDTPNFNSQPSNELIDDDNFHDAMGAGDEDIDPSYYEYEDPFVDDHELTDNELYNYGKW